MTAIMIMTIIMVVISMPMVMSALGGRILAAGGSFVVDFADI